MSLVLSVPLNVNLSTCFVIGGQRAEIKVLEERQEVERLWVNDGMILVSSIGGRPEWKCVGFVNSNVEEQQIEWEKADVGDKKREKSCRKISQAGSCDTNLCCFLFPLTASSFGCCCVHGCWLPALLSLSPINVKPCWRFGLNQRGATNPTEQRAAGYLKDLMYEL